MVNGQDIVNYAKNFLGVKYVFGGSSPNGFDCSGLVQYVYRHFGINISRTTKTQINDGREVGRNELQLGDLVFTDNGHVTIYIGDNKVIHAPQPGEVVKISNIWKFWRARRILSDNPPPPLPPPPRNINIGEFTNQVGTILHKTGKSFTFLLGDYNHDGNLDLYAISKSQTGSKSTEVHILSGKNNFQSWLLHTGTILHETGDNWEFCLGDYNHDGNLDLYAINKSQTGSKSTEVHILSGSNNFQSWLLHTGTILHETGNNWTFGVSNYAGQGNKDLYAINKSQTGSKSTEVHILSGKNNFQSWLMQTGTKLHETGDNFVFLTSGHNLYAIKKDGSSNSTEVHCLRI